MRALIDGNSSDLEQGGSGQRKRRRRRSAGAMAGSRHSPLLFMSILLCTGTFILILYALQQQQAQQSPASLLEMEKGHDQYPMKGLKNLVMVAGHSVYKGGAKCEKGGGNGDDDEAAWFLESYQRHAGQASTFVEHIRAGVQMAALDKYSLLLFSGGETRKAAGPRSEAQSYWSVAELHSWFGQEMDVQRRALTEEHARDSFENLLFSICRFRELTGSYPVNITVVSYDFKEKRFSHLHRSALRFPHHRFHYVGTPASLTSMAAALRGEALVRQQFQKDPYGCSGSLRQKRLGRDPFHRSIPYPNGCPELRGLFRYCGRNFFSGNLPWDN